MCVCVFLSIYGVYILVYFTFFSIPFQLFNVWNFIFLSFEIFIDLYDVIGSSESWKLIKPVCVRFHQVALESKKRTKRWFMCY